MKKINIGRSAATMAMALAAGMSSIGAPSQVSPTAGDGARIQMSSNARQTMAPQASQAQRAGQSQAHYGGQYDGVWGSPDPSSTSPHGTSARPVAMPVA